MHHADPRRTQGALQPDLVFGSALPQKASNANGKVVKGGLIIQVDS